MDKLTRIRLICLLSVSFMLACAQVGLFQPTPTPTPTSTATVTPTATSTPTQTPLPTPTAIPGWKKFEGRGVELWLPESFVGGNLDEDLDLILEKIKKLGPDYAQMAETLDQNREVFVLWAFDSKVGSKGFLANVNVTTQAVFSAITIDIFLDSVEKQLPPQFKVVERDMVPLGDRVAGRMVLQLKVSGVSAKELLYVIKEGNNLWLVTYAAAEKDFDKSLPVFEQSALTFRVQP